MPKCACRNPNEMNECIEMVDEEGQICDMCVEMGCPQKEESDDD